MNLSRMQAIGASVQGLAATADNASNRCTVMAHHKDIHRPKPGALSPVRGFTLIELVVIVLLIAVLAAAAMARFVDISTAARVARIRGVHGAVASAATVAVAQCRVTSGCYVATGPGTAMTAPDGVTGPFWYGAPLGATLPGSSVGIKEFVVVQGLTVVELGNDRVEFRDMEAADPTQCVVVYISAYNSPGDPYLAMSTSGC